MPAYLTAEDPWVIWGTVSAAIAAITSIAALLTMLIVAHTETWRRAREIQPRPRARWLPIPNGTSLSFYNVGGPAVDLLWIGVGGEHLWAAYATLPEHFADYMAVVASDLGNLPSRARASYHDRWATVWCFASDIDDIWWDCTRNQSIGRSIHRYLDDQLKNLELDSFAQRLWDVGRLGWPPGAKESRPVG